ncbi:MAG: ComEC/Rec2-related protein, partial [Candidatus Azotimanducaceae bacterium]
MAPIAYRSLAEAIAWSLPTAVLAGICLPAATAIAMVGILVATCSKYRWRRSALSALPVLLAAAPPCAAPLPPTQPGPVWVEGRVRDVVRAPLAGRNYVQLAEDLRVSFPGEIELVAGDRLRVLARAGEPAIPGVRGSLQAIPATMKVEARTWSFRGGCAQLRRAMERELLRLVPGEHGAMLATLVLGRATRPDPDLAAAHRATGLSHLLAVSGAHAAMLAFLLGLSSRGRHLGASRTRSAVVLTILLVYGSIAGAEPPVLRAVVAYTLAAMAARTGRPFGIATGLLVPAWITCLVAPDALLGPSFLLSYAAVIGLAMALRGRPPETLGEWLIDGLRA